MVLVPLADIFIIPSVKKQSEIGLANTPENIGATGAVRMTGLLVKEVSQVPSLLLTNIPYVPPPKPENVLDIWYVDPLSIEYSNVELPPIAVMEIEPSFILQLLGSEEATDRISTGNEDERVTGLKS